MVTPKQGEIYLAHLNPVEGHEQGGTRPVLVLQNDDLNEFLSTIVVAPITSNLTTKGKMTTYFLSSKNSKIKNDSVVLLFQVRTIDKSRLIKKITTLDPDHFQQILSQLRLVF